MRKRKNEKRNEATDFRYNESEELVDKLEQLKSILRDTQPLIVAYSGGVDSAFLLQAAVDTLGPDRVLGAIGVSPSLAPAELDDAVGLASEIGAECRLVETHELDDPGYVANDANRCYHCKKTLFDALLAIAGAEGYSTVVDGFNADDVGDWRPGEQAGRERGVRSPLKEADLSKDEIREYSRRYGLRTATKPAMACLASRLPYGVGVTAERLGQVGRAEQMLRDSGFRNVRVRHHGAIARIEVADDEMGMIWDREEQDRYVAGFTALGYRSVVLDLAGFESGCMNRMLEDADLGKNTDSNAASAEIAALGFDAVRIHAEGDLCRLVVEPHDRMRLSEPSLREAVQAIVAKTGCVFATLDLADEPAGIAELPQVVV